NAARRSRITDRSEKSADWARVRTQTCSANNSGSANIPGFCPAVDSGVMRTYSQYADDRRIMEIRVEGSLDQAMRVLKRKLAKEGVFKEMKKRAFYEKPSVRRKRKRSEAQRRRRKEQRRRRASSL